MKSVETEGPGLAASRHRSRGKNFGITTKDVCDGYSMLRPSELRALIPQESWGVWQETAEPCLWTEVVKGSRGDLR